MQTSYRSGQWYVVVLPGVLVALPPDSSEAVVTRLWERMPHERTLATVVDVLASDAGGALAALPSFVAVVAEGGDVRVALRGDAVARVRTPSAVQEFTGADVTTWSERFVGEASRVEIALEPADAAIALPVHSGVIRASQIVADLEPGDGHRADGAPDEAQAPHQSLPASGETPASTPDEPTPVSEATLAQPSEMTLAQPSEMTLAPPPEDIDHLWDATVHAPPADVPPAPPAPTTVEQGDHDGATISAAALRALRQQPPVADDEPALAVPVAAPETGRIRMSTGQVVTLDRTVIIGRRPRSTRASGANLPHLIAVDSPQQDISRSHLEIRPEGDTVVVIDLHTTNGSTLVRAGSDPIRLHPGEQTLVVSGDIVDLGDGVEVAFEDLP